MKHYFILARPHQWHKNGVVLAALVFAGAGAEPNSLILAFGAALSFALLSSSVVVINDLIYRDRDKLHYRKKDRPIAAGQVSTVGAIIFSLGLAGGGLTGAALVRTELLVIAILFLALNLLYSAVLKEIVILDVMALAISFVFRAYAGAVAVDVPASQWLIVTTLLLALFLGFGKRRHELVMMEEGAVAHRPSLGQYSPYLLDQCIGITTASVVVIYILYTFSADVSIKLGTQNLFLTIPFVIYGIFRYLYLIHRKDEGGSPSRVLIDDRPILLTVLLWLLTVVLILYWH